MSIKKELKEHEKGMESLQKQLNEANQAIQVLRDKRQQIINRMIGTNANIVLLQRLVKESKEVKKSVK